MSNFNNKEMDSTTLTEFQNFCKEMFELRIKYEEADRIAKDLYAKLEEKKAKILAYFEEFDLDKFPVKGFGTIGTQTKRQVKMPSDPENKEKLIEYLRTNNLDNVLTVNHNTLNALYKSKLEEAISTGGDTESVLPGIDGFSEYKTVTMRRES